MEKYKSRNEVPEKYKWDLTDFFKNEKEFQKEYKEIKKEVDNLKNYIGCTKDSKKLYEFLDKVGLEQFKNKYPSQLSGGMQQRVAIARALAMDTDILLMDEPFGAIDAKNRTILQELLLELWENATPRKTVVFVTHDIDEAILLSDKIVMMTANPGRVYRELKVPFARPRNRSELVQTGEYNQFRNNLLSLFYSDIADKIGGEEVVL